jgi:biotin synthase-related radical SAM superfamily protein
MSKYLQLKAQLLVEGIRVAANTFKGLGTKYKEQNHGLFGWDFKNHKDIILPDDFKLPDDTIVQFRYNNNSHYNIRNTKNNLILFNNDNEICEIFLIERPQFYNKKTTKNEDMKKIGQVGGEDCLFFCYQNYCSHFKHNKQCHFCNLVSTFQTYNSVLKCKNIDSIGEVAKAAWDEKIINHILLTGGCYTSDNEIEHVTKIINSIKNKTGLSRINGTILPSPAKGDNIKKYFDTGIKSIGYSMEIWDEKLYEALCPGKSEHTSHKDFINSITQAIKIFGKGNVYAVFVMGLESRETFIHGIKSISELGANIVPFVWSPNPGSKLAGHRAPTAEWYVDTILEASEIIYSLNIPSGIENHCYKCDGNSLLHDALRLKGIE